MRESFHYWLDTPTKKHDEIYALAVTTYSGEPTVRHRGLFINDEAPGLTSWWSMKHNVDYYPLDTEFYKHVFDMLLRLKANFIWPAMWASFLPRPGNIFFTDDPGNHQLATDYGIVVSTSHHEPMQRMTNEWNEDVDGSWDWTVNEENVTDFMRYGAERAKGKDSFFTLGMRGPNDGPIRGDDPIGTLREAFQVQSKILEDVYGNATDVKSTLNTSHTVRGFVALLTFSKKFGLSTKKSHSITPEVSSRMTMLLSCSRTTTGATSCVCR